MIFTSGPVTLTIPVLESCEVLLVSIPGLLSQPVTFPEDFGPGNFGWVDIDYSYDYTEVDPPTWETWSKYIVATLDVALATIEVAKIILFGDSMGIPIAISVAEALTTPVSIVGKRVPYMGDLRDRVSGVIKPFLEVFDTKYPELLLKPKMQLLPLTVDKARTVYEMTLVSNIPERTIENSPLIAVIQVGFDETLHTIEAWDYLLRLKPSLKVISSISELML